MSYLFIHYPKCGTCRKARKWLDEHNIDTNDRHIVENRPLKEELKDWITKSGLPAKKFFNTSGKKYKELNLKNIVKTETDEKLVEILASDGMLVKRPIIVSDNKVLVGFKQEEWEAHIK